MKEVKLLGMGFQINLFRHVELIMIPLYHNLDVSLPFSLEVILN